MSQQETGGMPEKTNNDDRLTISKLSPTSFYERVQSEFTQLQRQEDPRRINFTSSLKNKHKNRYLDILANEATIYPLPTDTGNVGSGSSTKCYINGNLIDLGLSHTFVACQAPLSHGIHDFLTVLYEKKISLVIMLTKLNEGGIAKADCYWPKENELFISAPGSVGIKVSTDPLKPYEVDTKLKITRRHLILQRSEEPSHKILQVQYTGWPDHGVPLSAASFETLLSIIKEAPTDVPVLVHCSAGIGRTGTLIGTYGVLSHLENGTLHDKTVYDIVSTMKRQRFGMVQRLEQYIVIYLTLLSRIGTDTTEFVTLLNQKLQTAASATIIAKTQSRTR
ncbi:putative tyrosine specific protein phosphatase [Trypanosoma theileri]|uniref:Putative tyrosine specific protein phosphatase n=1 Tax=Trypanosoma theileri TaxID=67003 RepID=A0A1X0P7M6_9TRYP|nr:putative tyrosine specific protein phosphatase [Trypanosoma theileri]ORC92946.1 putative tyrosine specific protein phosphatase [Trypanosoma theileri]